MRVVTLTFLCLMALCIFPRRPLAHGGGLNSSGCHNDYVHGGYHCHRGRSTRSGPPRSGRSHSARHPTVSSSSTIIRGVEVGSSSDAKGDGHMEEYRTQCGDPAASVSPINWMSYECTDDIVDGCLGFADYVTRPNAGCPGDQLCCPGVVRAPTPPSSNRQSTPAPAPGRSVALPPQRQR